MADTAARQTETWIVDPQHTVPIVPVHATAVHSAPLQAETAAANPIPAAADKDRLRSQLLRMIVKSEAQRRTPDEV